MKILVKKIAEIFRSPIDLRIKTIHTRINILLYITGLLFLLLLASLKQTFFHHEQLILAESRIQLQNEATTLIDNKKEILKQITYDYTFWDDFVNHLMATDTAWYANNITTILKSFRVDYVAVYDTTFKLQHEAATTSILPKSFVAEQTLERVKETKFLHFFQQTSDGLLEISAATVHPNNDPSHTLTRPSGYLVIARNWSRNSWLADPGISAAKAEIVSATDSVRMASESVISAYVPLKDWNNRVIANASFHRTSNLMVLYQSISLYMFLTMLVAFVLTWLILNFTIRKWVTMPLKLVTGILETNNAGYADELKQCPGEFKQIGGLFNDFVAQKKELVIAKERAEASDLLKSAFLANMSHEIRTPMNGILGFVELLKEPKLKDEDQQEYIGIIAESGKRMLNIINDIICISKVEAGQTELVISETNINDQLRYIFTFFKTEAELQGLELFCKPGLPDSNAHILTDREKLYAIITNLAKNAIKFTKRGFIEIGYERKGNFIEFYVRDTGVGIRLGQQKIIFERFRQANDSLSRHYEGAGLGLAISKAYVEMLGGKLWVESELERGSTFYFTIPYHVGTSAVPNENIDEPGVMESRIINGLKILIVEDDPISDLFLQKLSRSFAKEILSVNTGHDAVDTCREHPDINLVLMDIQMSGMDGYEATRQIRKFNTKVIILAQTALVLKGGREIALDAGCNDYLFKPISVGEFSNLIRKYFENKG